MIAVVVVSISILAAAVILAVVMMQPHTQRIVMSTCGNAICDSGENCQTCPEDCICGSLKRCEFGAAGADNIGCVLFCGNGQCDSGETKCSCPGDCGVCSGEAGTCREYYCQGSQCVVRTNSNCCGNGQCEDNENCNSCPIDCGLCPFCGDGECLDNENCVFCSTDCGSCPEPEPEPIEWCVKGTMRALLADKTAIYYINEVKQENGKTVCLGIYINDDVAPWIYKFAWFDNDRRLLNLTTDWCPLYWESRIIVDGQEISIAMAGKTVENGKTICKGQHAENMVRWQADITLYWFDENSNIINTTSYRRAVCGNGICEPQITNEKWDTCPDDCTICGDGNCFSERIAAIYYGDAARKAILQMMVENITNCPEDCMPICGNGECEHSLGESEESCFEDCEGYSWEGVCGDGKCQLPETNETCLMDCGTCGDGHCSFVREVNRTHTVCIEDCGLCRSLDRELCTSSFVYYCGGGPSDGEYGGAGSIPRYRKDVHQTDPDLSYGLLICDPYVYKLFPIAYYRGGEGMGDIIEVELTMPNGEKDTLMLGVGQPFQVIEKDEYKFAIRIDQIYNQDPWPGNY